jgi:hypothetical protein
MTGGRLFHLQTTDIWLHSFVHTALAPNLPSEFVTFLNLLAKGY